MEQTDVSKMSFKEFEAHKKALTQAHIKKSEAWSANIRAQNKAAEAAEAAEKKT